MTEIVNISYPASWQGKRLLPEGEIEVSVEVAEIYRQKGIVSSKPKKEAPAKEESTEEPKKPTKK